MPNWVTNKLTIEGPKSAEVMKSLLTKNEEDEYQFDFNKITPMPEELNIISGSLTEKAIEIYLSTINPDMQDGKNENSECFIKQKDLANKSKFFREYRDDLTKNEIEEIVENFSNEETLNSFDALFNYGKKAILNLEKYGAKDWYSWSIEHWGTKWNACHNIYDIENSPSEIMFDTAWSNVADLIAKLSTMHPENQFQIEFAEEWVGNQCGNLTFKNGEQINGEFFENGSKQAFEQAFKLWGEDLAELYVFDEKKQNYINKNERKSLTEEEM